MNIQEVLKSFKGKKILIVGDVMVDEYLWGDVTRISPEAPVPVVACDKREYRMGGAANVAINIKSLGAEPFMCTVIGDDEIGDVYQNLLRKREMTSEGIHVSPERITTVKTRVIGNHQQLLRVDKEITDFISKRIENEIINKVENIVRYKKIDALIFQDYDKGVLTENVIKKVTALCIRKNIPTLVDPKKRSFDKYHGVTLFKPNFKELVEGLNISVKKCDSEGIFKAVKEMHEQWKVKNVMVTLSELGVFVSNGETYKVLPAEKRDITDVSGAGDTVVSIAALALSENLSPFHCAALSNLAGGLVCEKVGVVPIKPDWLLKADYKFPDF